MDDSIGFLHEKTLSSSIASISRKSQIRGQLVYTYLCTVDSLYQIPKVHKPVLPDI